MSTAIGNITKRKIRWRTIIIFITILALTSLALLNCSPKQPVRLGFIGSMSGHYADFGVTGRNGALLAVEQRNQKGGIRGRQVELLIGDDGQNREQAIAAAHQLISEKIEVLIGPLTSAMTQAVLPVTTAANLIMVSPTSTAMEFVKKDDLLLRLASTSREYAQIAANFYYKQLGLRRIAIIYDLRNQIFAESTRDEFTAAFKQWGGVITVTLPFASESETQFANLVQALLETDPDGIFMITGTTDTVRISQQVRKRVPALPLLATVWASTEQLIELGGRDVEGIYLPQMFNRYDPSPRYQAFRNAYERRFQQQPGFVSLAAYDAANVVMDALEQRAMGEVLKRALLQGSFDGAQEKIIFDQYGDAQRRAFVTVIRQGKFLVAQ